MIRTEKFDEFFNCQPEKEFVEYLKTPVHSKAPDNFGKRKIESGEFCADGMYLSVSFEDTEEVLKTAFDDFELFLKVYKIDGNKYPVKVIKGETKCFEAYTVDVKEDGITLTANDTEGIRRGLIFIEDEIQRSEAPYLREASTSRYPHIKSRITRGFFSPTNRPPKFGDELSDDINYYPDEYLNRLAHDGTNGLWIYTRFSDIVPTKYIEEYGKGYERRIEKLRGVIKRCGEYGIKVYVLAIEPEAFKTKEMMNKYPQVWGATTWNGLKHFCTETEFGRNYCVDATEQMSKLLPGLGGFINLIVGERATNCGSSINNDCPRCNKIPRGVRLARGAEILREGMRRAGTDAEMISWTYGHRSWKYEDILDYIESAPKDAVIMQNFEDMCLVDQLGRTRMGVDYWLSYPGPSDFFKFSAEAVKKQGKRLFAKMQICCSHEVASVPYIPAPGIIFEKMKGAYECGVEGIMECWYFGNYPSIMSKVAGELSFVQDYSDKKAFLKRLAGIYWGKSQADKVVQAWELFEAGYTQYPINIMFSYYGPMHDSVVWELQLKPKNFSLPRSWFSTDKTDGDRIAESFMCGHTIDEIVTLISNMSGLWSKGAEIMNTLSDERFYNREEQKSAANALNILFESGRNILEFYQLRRKLNESPELLSRMEELVKREIELSKAMIPLWHADKRLGYHSEAENYKFFPEKIEYRIESLEKLLKTEFVEIKERIASGVTPLEYYEGVEEGIPHYDLKKSEWVELLDGTSSFRAYYDETKLYIEVKSTEKKNFKFSPEFELMVPAPTMVVCHDGTLKHGRQNFQYYAMIGDMMDKEMDKWHTETFECEGTHFIVSVDREKVGWTDNTPIKMRIGEDNDDTNKTYWIKEDEPVHTLGKNEVSPGEFGWLMP